MLKAGHLIFEDPDPAVFLNADPNPVAFLMRIRIQLKKLYEEFAVVEKKDCSKVKTMELFLEKFNKITIITNFFAFFLLLFFLAYPDPGGKMNEV